MKKLIYAHNSSFFTARSLKSFGVAATKSFAHAGSQGAISHVRTGSFRSGFVGGFTSSGLSVGSSLFGDSIGAIGLRTGIMALLGGTAAHLVGGDFAAGAISAAFVHMYNGEVPRLMKRLYVSHKAPKVIYANDKDALAKLNLSIQKRREFFQENPTYGRSRMQVYGALILSPVAGLGMMRTAIWGFQNPLLAADIITGFSSLPYWNPLNPYQRIGYMSRKTLEVITK